jgi:hypothetical protein
MLIASILFSLSLLSSFIYIDYRLRKIENTLFDMEQDRRQLRHDLGHALEENETK